MRATLLLVVLFGCALDRTGLAAPDGRTDGGARVDATIRSDAGPRTDSGCVASPETCNGVDEDCDGTVDEDTSGMRMTFYEDIDGDGHGNPDAEVTACAMPPGYVTTADDCDDACPSCWMGAVELCDELDNDCNGETDEGVSQTFYRDADGDSAGDPAMSVNGCALPPGYVSNADDCDDECVDCQPGAPERCDGRDNDCDGHIDNGSSPGESACGCPRMERGDRAYLLCVDRLSWAVARRFCTDRGYDLVKVETEGEHAALHSAAFRLSSGPWWIGLSDTMTEGSFVWVDGTPLGSFRPWRIGEPNNGGNEDCVEMQDAFVGSWNDKECEGDGDRPYICEVSRP